MSLALAPLDVSVELEANLPCRKFDPDLWFSDSPAQLELAKSLCGDCPLRVECLAGAVERNEPWGVWGGEIFERGAVVPRKIMSVTLSCDHRACSGADGARLLQTVKRHLEAPTLLLA